MDSAQLLPPRLQPEKNAADQVGLDLSTFRHLVDTGRLPKPMAETGLFDMKAIDAALDRISGLGAPGNALDAWSMKRRDASTP